MLRTEEEMKKFLSVSIMAHILHNSIWADLLEKYLKSASSSNQIEPFNLMESETASKHNSFLFSSSE